MTRLLLVEDSEDVRETLAYLLAREGYEVKTASTGSAALKAFERESPDIVLLDLMIPEVPGIDVLRAIRRTSDVPIMTRSGVWQSAMAEPSFKNSGLETTVKSKFRPRCASSRPIISPTRPAVATGTVDLLTTIRS